MKTLKDIKRDMSELYDDFKAGALKREDVDALANVAGKFLKADAQELAREMFLAEYPAKAARVIEHEKEPAQLANQES